MTAMNMSAMLAQEDTAQKVRVLILCRLVILAMGLALTLVFHRAFAASVEYNYLVIAPLLLVSILSLIYIALLRVVRRQRAFAVFQLAVDILMITLVVYFTGGLFSVFKILYLPILLAASMILSMAASLVFASLTTVILLAVMLAYLLAPAPFVDDYWMDYVSNNLGVNVATLAAFVFALYLISYLTGLLAARLRGEMIVKEEILDNISDGLVVFDQFRRVVYLNNSAGRLLSCPPMGRRTTHGHARNENLDRIARRVFETSSGQYRTVTADSEGRRTPVEVRSSLIRSRQGKFRGVVAILADLSDRVRMERALKRVERFEVLRQLSACIAHEIRNPLASIRGSAQELARGGGPNGANQSLLNIIVGESDRLNHIISGFLMYARTSDVHKGRCDLKELVEEVILMMRKGNIKEGHTIDAQLPGELYCHGDYNQIKQVFLNLGLNALEAMDDGGRLLIATEGDCTRADDGKVYIRIDFVDNGPGIAPEIREKLFEPFATTKQGGTGLGLAVVENIVSAHDGRIEIVNLDQGGTRASVWLPVGP